MSMYDDFDSKSKIVDVPGHESGCPWVPHGICICDTIYEIRRMSYNEGWVDGYEEGFDEGFSRGERMGRA